MPECSIASSTMPTLESRASSIAASVARDLEKPFALNFFIRFSGARQDPCGAIGANNKQNGFSALACFVMYSATRLARTVSVHPLALEGPFFV